MSIDDDVNLVKFAVTLISSQYILSELLNKTCAKGAFEAQFDFQIFKQIWRHTSSRSSRLKVFCEKVVLTKFAICTAKHMCWRLFLIKLKHT